jgi:hypothetical protein
MRRFGIWGLAILIVGTSAGRTLSAEQAKPTRAATVLIATANSSSASKATADLVGDGQGDQEEINAAIAGLPEAGDVVISVEDTTSENGPILIGENVLEKSKIEHVRGRLVRSSNR